MHGERDMVLTYETWHFGGDNLTLGDSPGHGQSVQHAYSFRVSCSSTHLSWAQVPTFAGSSVWDKKKKKGVHEGGGTAYAGGTSEYKQSDQGQ